MSGTAIVAQIVEILVSGITGMATGIGSGLSSLVQNVFFVNEGNAMSIAGTMIVVFAAISLAVSLGRLVVGWLFSLGGRSVR